MIDFDLCLFGESDSWCDLVAIYKSFKFLAQRSHPPIMEDEPLSNVTIFNNTKEAIIHGGDFSVHHHNAIKSESDTDISTSV